VLGIMLAVSLLSAPTAVHCAEVDEPWEELLGQIGLTRETAQLPPDRWRDGGLHSLPDFTRLWDDWFLVRPTGRQWADLVVSTAGNCSAPVLWGADRLGTPIDRDALPPLQQDSQSSPRQRLLAALMAVHTAAGDPLDAGRLAALTQGLEFLPDPAASAAAIALEGCPAALECRKRAFASCEPDDMQTLHDQALAFSREWSADIPTMERMEKTDLQSLMQGAAVLSRHLGAAREAVGDYVAGPFSFHWDTPLGSVRICGGAGDEHPAGSYLLLCDLGGDDTYPQAAISDATHPISLLLDCDGNDRYGVEGRVGPAAAVVGYAMLLDCAGNDRYEAGSVGQGAGICGAGILVDLGGDDTYRCTDLGQGAAVHGFGCLVDRSGTDSYYCIQKAQGFGGVRGCGLLCDAEGDDRYEAEDSKITDPSPQTKEHNVSLAQGAGFGRRAHPGDKHSLAGGIGMLADGGGNDTYSCGVFGQGTAYWYSLGLLVDEGGEDQYKGVWYVQGSSAHMGVAGLLEVGGNDAYTATMTSSQGFGHDYGTGTLCDYAGDDTYNYPQVLARGNASGISIVCDLAGKDAYNVAGLAGSNTGERPGVFCLGLFMDLGGDDAFPASDSAIVPKGKWVRVEPGEDRKNSWGLGIDR